ncbi:MAG: SO_0444 family Cu/Zn efflux transporter [Duncaniella sp.]|nr:SO_0444 family Cu/Zn efflux transporter [Duncaniella sp.]
MDFAHFFSSLLGIVNEMSPYILLGFLIAGLLQVFVRPSAMSRHLSGKGAGPVVKAALFGIPLPLCSCGVLPTAVALSRRGASRGATTSFLIATPQTGVDSIAATYSLLGLPFALLRPVAALVGATFGGLAVNRFAEDPSQTVAATAAGGKECGDACSTAATDDDYTGMSVGRRLVEVVRYGFVDMVASVGKWLMIGLIVAALITVLVPDELFLSLRRYPLAAMAVMIVVAVPMYICATGSIPIALSLMMKGLSPGVAFVLLMAGPAANFASVMILGRTMGRRATGIYVGSVIVTAVAFGLLIDYLLPASWFMPERLMAHAGCHGGGEWHFPLFPTLCSALLLGLLIYAAFRSRSHSHKHIDNQIENTTMTQEIQITGMACEHCRSTVFKALSALPGVESVDVNLSTGVATVEGNVDRKALTDAIYAAGFNVKE